MTNTKLRVLIAEDSEDDAFLVVRELERNHFDVTYQRVSARQDLEQALEENRWDVILCDFTMPQFNGIEALSVVRQKDADVPFIFVSGTIGEDVAVNAMKAGANDYVIKGNIKRLAPAIQRELRDVEVRRERVRVEKKLRESEALFRYAVDHAAIGMALMGIDGHFMDVNPALCKMLGYSAEDLHKLNHFNIIDPIDQSNIKMLLSAMLIEKQVVQKVEVRYRNYKGDVVCVLLNISLVFSAENVPLYFILQAEDITKQKLSEQKLSHLIHHDALTGLANRRIVEEEIHKFITNKDKTLDDKMSVLLIDLDRFRIVNETLGHDIGDLFLQAVARRLKSELKDNALLSRIGGDEFAVMLSEVKDIQKVIDLAQMIILAFSTPFIVRGQEIFASASIGIALYPHDGLDSFSLFRHADIAMYQAKQSGGNIFHFCTPNLPTELHGRMVLSNALRHALENDELLLYYQPKVDLRTGKIMGIEALVRWRRQSGDLVPPDQFIPLAEETGLIVQIGEWVMRTACLQNKRWHEQGLSFLPITMAINLSSRQFRDNYLEDIIVNILKETRLQPELLELEITETMVLQAVEHNLVALKKIKDLGVELSIDDFGTGYSSLSYLKRFSVNRLKIDKSFITNIPHDSNDIAITKAIIAMAHSLNIRVIAEGVETKEQLDFLRENGCDEIQGYFFSPPLDTDSMTKLLKENPVLN